MSSDAMWAVWLRSRARGDGLVVMLAIADQAGYDGSVELETARLARKARMSEEELGGVCAELEQLGELTFGTEAPARGGVVFRVLVPGADLSGGKWRGGKGSGGGRSKGSGKGEDRGEGGESGEDGGTQDE